jgi:hypothetical protein
MTWPAARPLSMKLSNQVANHGHAFMTEADIGPVSACVLHPGQRDYPSSISLSPAT